MGLWQWLVGLFRVLVGALFVFSGTIKGIDPVGFAYKLQEYGEVFHIPLPLAIALPLSIFFCVLEVFLGLSTLTGFAFQWASPILVALMVFFLFLTGYSAITGAVQDCGCFGEAIKLTPWQTFWKDVVLMGMILVLFVFRRNVRSLPGSRIVTIGLTGIAGALFIFWSIALPPLDFRPYKVGNDLWALMQIPEDAPQPQYETIIIYRNRQTGERIQMNMEEFQQRYQEFADTTKWEFDTTITIEIQPGYTPPIQDFLLQDPEGNDYTEQILHYPKYYLFVVLEATRFSARAFRQTLKEIDRVSQVMPVYILTSFTSDQWEKLRQEYAIEGYPVFFVDGVALKTMIRSSPGFVLMRGPVVQGKWSWVFFSAEKVLEAMEG